MSGFHKLEQIDVWIRARHLAKSLYQLTARESIRRDFGYSDQLRRSTISIMSNIAEGFGRDSDRDFARFLDIARGSASETYSLLHVGFDVGYLEQEEFDQLGRTVSQVIAQITTLNKYLRKSPSR